ncbi:AmmeMemoRadiSam system protein B [Magnetovirga frankeli]|uniref:AmmeMemoRadiSam system protein B n=1 Tax=Magnetovirga frankeli TaxID=947516 RepID=UPI0012937EB7|nr:AmmeMemoRadiSam system protein B [gamma proteobacterium SS-5]
MDALPQPRIQQPVVAGLFYPAQADRLQQDLASYLRQARLPATDAPPRALIVPHAGYPYSGPVAASAYCLLQAHADRFQRVLLLGPAHRLAFAGLALPSADALRSPLGDMPLDRELCQRLLALPFVQTLDAAFAQEHCLEVQLPFLQTLLDGFQLAPLLIGQSHYAQVTQVLRLVADDPHCLILISSDLSHYQGYSQAQRQDQHSSERILALDAEGLGPEDACGRIGIGGLLELARSLGWRPQLLDLRNSGDTAGARDQVVGYGAYAFF